MTVHNPASYIHTHTVIIRNCHQGCAWEESHSVIRGVERYGEGFVGFHNGIISDGNPDTEGGAGSGPGEIEIVEDVRVISTSCDKGVCAEAILIIFIPVLPTPLLSHLPPLLSSPLASLPTPLLSHLLPLLSSPLASLSTVSSVTITSPPGSPSRDTQTVADPTPSSTPYCTFSVPTITPVSEKSALDQGRVTQCNTALRHKGTP